MGAGPRGPGLADAGRLRLRGGGRGDDGNAGVGQRPDHRDRRRGGARRAAGGGLRLAGEPGTADPSRGLRHHQHHRRHGPGRAAVSRGGRSGARGARRADLRGPQRPVRLGFRERRAAPGRDLALDGPRLCTVGWRAGWCGIASCALDSLQHWFGLEYSPATGRRATRSSPPSCSRGCSGWRGEGADAAGPRRHRARRRVSLRPGAASPTEPRAGFRDRDAP
jgi:hypothetical protein